VSVERERESERRIDWDCLWHGVWHTSFFVLPSIINQFFQHVLSAPTVDVTVAVTVAFAVTVIVAVAFCILLGLREMHT